MIIHPISPVYDKNSKILILGSFPSVRSREEGFFYGHPQNRFWKTIAAVYEEDTPHSIEEKKALLLRNHIALWDVIRSCEIEGSSDASIRDVIPNDINIILKEADIRQIYVNGKTALKYYQRYIELDIGRMAICLPSTSPANASYNAERLLESWKQIRLGSYSG
ncbi:MAG: DNA-deoxyinosine glycosylase [Clostridiales bacterium]|nr:DNA-deoxyinosine glycosylase [Clostridiales bacterium]